MRRARSTRIVPISEQILLLVFKDTQTEKHDAKFILHQIPDVKPRSDPEGFKAYLYENEHLIPERERDIKCDACSSERETAEVTLSAPEDEWAKMEPTCASMNITVESFALALAYFASNPEQRKLWSTGMPDLISNPNSLSKHNKSNSCVRQRAPLYTSLLMG